MEKKSNVEWRFAAQMIKMGLLLSHEKNQVFFTFFIQASVLAVVILASKSAYLSKSLMKLSSKKDSMQFLTILEK